MVRWLTAASVLLGLAPAALPPVADVAAAGTTSAPPSNSAPDGPIHSASAYLPPPSASAQNETGGTHAATPPPAPTEGWDSFSHWKLVAGGKVQRTLSIYPAYRHTASGWQPVDDSLHAASNASWPVSAPNGVVPLQFGAGADHLLQLQLAGGAVTLSAAGLAGSHPTLQGNTVTYHDVAPDTDLRYTVTAADIKEELILRSAKAPQSFSFHLADPSHALGTLSGKDDGPRSFSTLIDGDVRIGLAQEFAYTAASAATGTPPHLPGSAHQHVVAAGDGYDVTVSVDAAWAHGKSYPLVLDPTLTLFQGNGTMTAGFVAYGNSTYDPCNGGGCVPNTSSDLSTGTFTGGGYDLEPSRSIFHFDVSQLPPHSQINAATLMLYTSGCMGASGYPYLCNQHSYTIEEHNLHGGWDPTYGFAYSTYDDLNADMDSTAIYTINQAPFNAAPGSGFYMNFDMVSELQGWVNGTLADNGVVITLHPPEPYDIGGPYWNYLGPNGNSGGNLPQLQITYTPPPDRPTSVSAAAGNGLATVTWGAPYNNGGPAVSSYTVTAYTASGSALSSQTVCASCYTATFAVSNGQTYYFSVVASNSVGAGLPAYTSVYKAVDMTTLAQGQVATYSLLVDNPTSSAVSVSATTDSMPPGLVLDSTSLVNVLTTVGGLVQGTAQCGYCHATSTSLSIDAFTLQPGEFRTFTYQAVAALAGRDCSTQTNHASVTNSLGTFTSSVPVSTCDGGLGLEAWWDYVSRAVGPQGTASVNVANGNLVLQQTDSTPIQAHGRLAYVIRRTYNSEDSTLLTAPGSLGTGWVFNVDQSDSLLGGGVGATSLYVPSLESVASPGAVTLIDRDGTRHVFSPRAVSSSLNVLTTTGAAVSGDLGLLVPRVLAVDPTKYTNICVDETYQAPPGVHLALWRYFEVNSALASNPCVSGLLNSAPVLLGFAAERPDRVRYEFSADGHMLDVEDAAGNDLRYVYTASPAAGVALGNLTTVYEPRGCPAATQLLVPSTCRAIRFAYPSTTEMDVTDPAGRVTKYLGDGALPNAHLTSVVNPDGSVLQYSYGGCGGTANQLCAVTDPRGASTHFTYSSVPAPGQPQVATVTDRRGVATTFTYVSSPDYVTADESGHRQRFQGIDAQGRVAEVDEGDTSNNYLHQVFTTWDGDPDPLNPGAGNVTCRKPDNQVDNDVCKRQAKSLASTPDDVTTYSYNSEGQTLAMHQSTGSATLDTTFGYHAQYIENSGSVLTYNDTVAGSGNVTSDSSGGVRGDGASVYVVSDRVQSLTPRGNAAGSGFAPYLTTTLVDDNAAVSPNSVPASTVCTTPAVPTSNTGLPCEVDAPAFDGTHATVTRYTYDTFGQKATMTTPKAIAETPAGQTPVSYSYTYYSDPVAATDPGNGDISGTTPAGGWLKAVSDPTGNFVAYGYDAAGDVVRTWDRDATQGLQVAAFPGTVAAPPSMAYTEAVREPTTPSASGYASPWRYVASTRDQLGNTTTYLLDGDGNQLGIRPPRGNPTTLTPTAICGTSPGPFDTCQSFDNGDLLLSRHTPAEAAGQNWSYGYDAFGNRTSQTDPNGHVTVWLYDSVNRSTGMKWTRGAWPGDNSQPAACVDSTSADVPIPAGRILCSTSTAYDGVNNVTSSQDGNHHTSTISYDGVHRVLSRVVPRNDGTLSTLTTGYVYDADGHVLEVCRPRQYSEGGATSCQLGALYGTQTGYDVAGRPVSAATHRSSTETDTALSGYDADGNLVSQTDQNSHTTTWVYDFNDRKTAMSVPRDSLTANTTAWTYDPSGFVTSQTRPAGEITAYSYDADHRPVDTVQGADNTNAALAGPPGTTGGTNVRSRVAYDADGNVIARYDPRAFTASTTVPDATYMMSISYDADDRPVAQSLPRYDAVLHSNLDSTGVQAAQCPTGASGYPTGVGVCTSRASYDAAGNVTRVTLPTSNGSDNRYVLVAYTDDNLVQSVNSPAPDSQTESRVTADTRYYDGDGKPTKSVDALGHAQSVSYYDDETVAVETGQPNGTLTHTSTHYYNADGLQTKLVDGSGNTSTASYYADDKQSDAVDGAGDDTHYVDDPVGNLLQQFSPSAMAKDATNPSGTPTTNTYSFDNLVLTSSTPVAGDGSSLRRVSYGYDTSGRKTTTVTDLVSSSGTVLQAGQQQAFTYYPDDRLQQQTGRGGETIVSNYDPAGNATSIADSSGGSSTLTATYYLDGSLRNVDDGSVTEQYGYDAQGARVMRADVNDLSKDTSQKSYATTYGYNDAELPVSMSSAAAGGGSTTRQYDKAGHLTLQVDPNSERTSLSYNADDTLSSQTLATSGGATLAAWSYTYNGDYLESTQSYSGSGASAAAGQMSFGYDAANRLHTLTFGATTVTINWDHNGNRLNYQDLSSGTTTSFTYHADNTIANSGYVYDAEGRLVSDSNACYAYDGFDRLATVSSYAASCPGATTTATYTYDGLDRQRGSTQGTTSTVVHHDGLGQSVSEESSGGTDTVYELSPSGEPMAATKETVLPTTQYLAGDGTGNISTVTTASQTVACSARLDPFGTPMAAQGTSNPCDSGSSFTDVFYRGARRDAATGQYEFGSRTYDPGKAAFLTPDSYRAAPAQADNALKSDPLTANTYTYVNGDPVNLADPNGHNPCRDEDPNACDPDQNRALTASDRGADISGSPHEPTISHASESQWLADIGAGEPRPRTYHSPPSVDSCDVRLYMFDGCAGIPGPDYGGAHPETLTINIPKERGYGALYGDLFIPTDQSCLLGAIKCLRGDDRGFSPHFDPRNSRAFFYFDYEAGKATFVVNPSCNGTSTDCNDALDITQSRWLSELHRNLIQVDDFGDGRIVVHTELSNSEITPVLAPPSIDNTWIIIPGNNDGRKQFSIAGEGDQYPSAEFYHLNHGRVTLGAQYTAATPWMLEGPLPDRDYLVDSF